MIIAFSFAWCISGVAIPIGNNISVISEHASRNVKPNVSFTPEITLKSLRTENTCAGLLVDGFVQDTMTFEIQQGLDRLRETIVDVGNPDVAFDKELVEMADAIAKQTSVPESNRDWAHNLVNNNFLLFD